MTPEDLLRKWLAGRLDAAALQWVEQSAAKLAATNREADVNLAFTLAPRKTGKADMRLTAAELAEAERARTGWDPSRLSVDQATRLYLLLACHATGDVFERRLDQLCATADVAELVLLYTGLPLYPEQERYRLRAAEGVRTNMKIVFEAVAQRNPYPSEQLGDDAWNQLVLKALFVGSALHPIVGLDRRANPALARMLCDYAHERWSAGRPVSPELWRCVGPFASGNALEDLNRVLAKGTEPEREAAALALASSDDPAAARTLAAHPALAGAVANKAISWQSLSFAA
jgi:hypothetical protein